MAEQPGGAEGEIKKAATAKKRVKSIIDSQSI